MARNTAQHGNNLVPELRFVECGGEWTEKRLGDICSRPMYGMNAPAKPFDGHNIYLRITDIDETTGFLKKAGLTSPNGKLVESYLLREGDLIFARTGASVGKTYLYKQNDGKNLFCRVSD